MLNNSTRWTRRQQEKNVHEIGNLEIQKIHSNLGIKKRFIIENRKTPAVDRHFLTVPVGLLLLAKSGNHIWKIKIRYKCVKKNNGT